MVLPNLLLKSGIADQVDAFVRVFDQVVEFAVDHIFRVSFWKPFIVTESLRAHGTPPDLASGIAALTKGGPLQIFRRIIEQGSETFPVQIGGRFHAGKFCKCGEEVDQSDGGTDLCGGPGPTRGGQQERNAGDVIQAFRGKVPHVIFCSTTTVYGRPFERVPVVEEAARLDPPSPYGEGKLACERALREAERAGDFAVTILRPAHIYNERSLPLHSLGNRTSHLDRIRTGRPIVVHDDGQGLWSSLWVEEAAAAFVAATLSPVARGRTYHLAGAEPYTWNWYHAQLATGLGAPVPRIRNIPVETLAQLAPGRTMQLQRTLRFPGVYDCSAAERDLGFQPRVGPSEGFTRNLRHLAENGLIEPWEKDQEYEILARHRLRHGEACFDY